MRRRLRFRLEAAASGLDHDARVDACHRAGRLADDCGCAMGGVFLWVALLVVAPALVVTRGPSPYILLAAVGVVVVAAGLGKLVGIAVAALRLLVLARHVEKATDPRSRRGHVHVH